MYWLLRIVIRGVIGRTNYTCVQLRITSTLRLFGGISVHFLPVPISSFRVFIKPVFCLGLKCA